MNSLNLERPLIVTALFAAVQPIRSQPAPFRIVEATIDDVRAALASKQITTVVVNWQSALEAREKR